MGSKAEVELANIVATAVHAPRVTRGYEWLEKHPKMLQIISLIPRAVAFSLCGTAPFCFGGGPPTLVGMAFICSVTSTVSHIELAAA